MQERGPSETVQERRLPSLPLTLQHGSLLILPLLPLSPTVYTRTVSLTRHHNSKAKPGDKTSPSPTPSDLYPRH